MTTEITAQEEPAEDETQTSNEIPLNPEPILTDEDIKKLVQKQLSESPIEYCTMSPEQIVDFADEVRERGVPMELFDFRTFTAQYYREKFPGFPPEFYNCMEKASAQKFVDQSDPPPESKYKFEQGEYNITFGGEDESQGIKPFEIKNSEE